MTDPPSAELLCRTVAGGPEMAEVLLQLREEHANMKRLLAALEHQLALFDKGEQPDYDVFLSAADYFTGFSDCCHHPKEDLILQRIKQVDPDAAQSIPDLEAEHQQLGVLARHFHEAVTNVLEEVEVPRSAFDAVLRHFVGEQRRHMHMEEERFFPLAESVLTEEDWAALDRKVTKESDPLFGGEVAEEYRDLLRAILAWEREDEAHER
jgi:hemerythrin-like domain-containing protein